MAGTDVETFRTAWVPVNVRTVLLNTPHVRTAVYVLVCSLINKKTSPVLVELLRLYKISYFSSTHVAKKYDNHKQALTETAARECQCV